MGVTYSQHRWPLNKRTSLYEQGARPQKYFIRDHWLAALEDSDKIAVVIRADQLCFVSGRSRLGVQTQSHSTTNEKLLLELKCQRGLGPPSAYLSDFNILMALSASSSMIECVRTGNTVFSRSHLRTCGKGFARLCSVEAMVAKAT